MWYDECVKDRRRQSASESAPVQRNARRLLRLKYITVCLLSAQAFFDNDMWHAADPRITLILFQYCEMYFLDSSRTKTCIFTLLFTCFDGNTFQKDSREYVALAHNTKRASQCDNGV